MIILLFGVEVTKHVVSLSYMVHDTAEMFTRTDINSGLYTSLHSSDLLQ